MRDVAYRASSSYFTLPTMDEINGTHDEAALADLRRQLTSYRNLSDLEQALNESLIVQIDNKIRDINKGKDVNKGEVATTWKIYDYIRQLSSLPEGHAAVAISNAYLSIMFNIAAERGYDSLDAVLGNVVGYKQKYANTENAVSLWHNILTLNFVNLPEIELIDGAYTYEPNGMYA